EFDLFPPGRAEARAPERPHPALRVADREHEPAAEAIVEAGGVLAGKNETRLREQLLADPVPAHEAEEIVPAFRRIAEPEAPRHLVFHPAARVLVTGLVGARSAWRP